MNKKIYIIVSVALLIVGGVFFTGRNTYRHVSGKLQIATSFYPLYFFAIQIGGNKADVYNITPASTEPHDYEPTTQDIVRVSQSAMLVLNGGKLEAWGEKIQDELQGTPVLIVTAGQNVANRQVIDNGTAIQDPHAWLDPLLAEKEVIVIEKGFETIDPKNASYFQANATKLSKQLDLLNTEFMQGLGNCQRKDFVTSHAAFGYLAARYGLRQIAISGISPDEEPSSQKLAEITNIVKKENIKIIFFESLISPKLSQTIAQETGAQTMVLNPIEGLTQEDLQAGKNYFTVMRDNLLALQTALQCNQ